MEEETLEMPQDMRLIHAQLVDLQRRFQELLERDHTSAEAAEIFKELQSLDQARIANGGAFAGDIEAPVPGQTVCMELLSHNFELARQCARTAHDEPDELRLVADSLMHIRNDLRKLMGLRHHTGADIAHYRFLLAAIAATEGEYGGEWEDSAAEELLVECTNMVEQLEATAEEMPPAVQAEYSVLQKLKRELSVAHSFSGKPADEDLKRWHDTAGDIDQRRATHGGVFGGEELGSGVNAPPGQVVCSNLLHECFTMIHDLEERC